MNKNYQKPTMRGIGAGAEKLYELESQRNEVIKKCAKEQGIVLGHSHTEFWTHSLPEQLASILESFDRKAAQLAAIAFLEKSGVVIFQSEDAQAKAAVHIANLEHMATGAALYNNEKLHNQLKDAAGFIKSTLPVS